MATSIPAVQGNNINTALLIDLTLGPTTYYISSAYNSIVYGGNTYQYLGAFLGVTQIQEDIKTTNGDVSISLSGVPDTYIDQVLDTKIKGGEAVVYRAFFNEDYTLDSANVYQRFKGIITNYAIEENIDILEGDASATVSVSCASINTILENKVAGQRTNPEDRKKFFPTDSTFNHVPDLMGVAFDFGKEYNSYAGGGGYNGGGGRNGNPFDFGNFNMR
tara:strand:- start:6920 stop:7576 length:657 start_codon:yes stop_codon:yes gene_type:complete